MVEDGGRREGKRERGREGGRDLCGRYGVIRYHSIFITLTFFACKLPSRACVGDG